MAISPTTRRGIPKPDGAENVDVPTDIAAVADSVDNDTRTFTGLESARAGFVPAAVTGGIPAGWKDGERWISTDTGVEWARVGGAYVALNPKDAAANVASLRTLGPGATQAAPGNDARFSDQRAPTNGSVTGAKLAPDAPLLVTTDGARRKVATFTVTVAVTGGGWQTVGLAIPTGAGFTTTEVAQVTPHPLTSASALLAWNISGVTPASVLLNVNSTLGQSITAHVLVVGT